MFRGEQTRLPPPLPQRSRVAEARMKWSSSLLWGRKSRLPFSSAGYFASARA